MTFFPSRGETVDGTYLGGRCLYTMIRRISLQPPRYYMHTKFPRLTIVVRSCTSIIAIRSGQFSLGIDISRPVPLSADHSGELTSVYLDWLDSLHLRPYR